LRYPLWTDGTESLPRALTNPSARLGLATETATRRVGIGRRYHPVMESAWSLWTIRSSGPCVRLLRSMIKHRRLDHGSTRVRCSRPSGPARRG